MIRRWLRFLALYVIELVDDDFERLKDGDANGRHGITWLGY